MLVPSTVILPKEPGQEGRSDTGRTCVFDASLPNVEVPWGKSIHISTYRQLMMHSSGEEAEDIRRSPARWDL